MMSAPYNFVPLSEKVHFPDWAGQVSQDLPFSDGLCGSIGFEVVAHTPLLVAGEAGQDPLKTFVRLPDGTVAIPGSTLRGMIRAVVEIASFGKFGRVDDRAMSLRDLAGPMRAAYGNEMTTTSSNKTYAAKSKAGWLCFHEGKWKLQPCVHLRVDYAVLDRLSGLHWNTDREKGNWRKSALDKYTRWKQSAGSLDIFYVPANTKAGQPEAIDHPHSGGKFLNYIKVMELMAPGTPRSATVNGLKGHLVFTGHPSPKKHMDFVFSPANASGKRIDLPDEVMRTFLQIHGETSEWLQRWRPQVNNGGWAPVFYLPDAAGLPKAMGLSQMFKLAYRHSIHEAIRKSSEDHLEENQRDLAELIFGDAPAGEAEGNRGRVSFSPARLAGQPEFLSVVETVLNGPKPSFFPNYIRQTPQAETAGNLYGAKYTTLMDADTPKLRGWKRYPARPKERVAPPPRLANQNNNVISRLRPLSAGACFSGQVRIHNLREVELGALLWAMTWGDREDCAHGLGMGKPFGYGQVRLANLDISGLRRNDGQPTGDLNSYLDRFLAHMRKAVGGWDKSEQLNELLAMAKPQNAVRVNLEHYSTDPRAFAQAKTIGLVLKRYSRLVGN
jgi:CRISPR-associated protein (TIGR03986 family)